MPSILIIEDDATLLRGLRDNFMSRGFDVSVATDGTNALDAATQDSTDIILLDIMLPHVNGYEICRRVREAGVETPIVMLTAKGQEDDIIRGLELGADDYVTKPFSIRELAARVKSLLRRKEPDTLVRFGDCDVNLAAQTLRRNGKLIPLTTKEFRLLALFLRRPGRALTRNEILDAVWGHSVIVTGRSVDRCVTTLRSKVEPDPRNPQFIGTIRDIGYRFELPCDA
ncbi:MAG: response regulator transcription factor [Planctomycetes bacterium]|nr:response regulator transcription factor [Planctomycetota bacterium]